MASNHEYFKDVYDFLSKFRWIFRSSNTKFLAEGVLNEIPLDWVTFLQSLATQQLNQLPFGLQHEKMPSSLHDFFFQLERLRPVHSINVTNPPVAKFSGISPKKLHEIHKFSIEINSLITSNSNDMSEANVIIVDLGCGLGYLSQLLAKLYGYRVLGLEADPERVIAARRRQTKYFGNTLNSVFYAEHFIETTKTAEFIKQEIIHNFNPLLSSTRIALVGLHACADLTVTACRLFGAIDIAVILSIMPCCYHKMQINSTGFDNIPLSRCMQMAVPTQASWSAILNRPFLRLACQQTATRWAVLSSSEHEIHGSNMYNRGLVELVLHECEHVSKLPNKKSASCENVLNTYQLYSHNVPIPWSEEHIKRMEQLFHHNGAFLSEVLTGLQAAVQSICENVVLMDKVCYLQEMHNQDGTTNRFVGLKKIFKETLSPRCYTLFAIK